MPPVRAIFFDIGDTLVFDEPPLPERFWHALGLLGLTVDKTHWPQAYRVAEDYALSQYLNGVSFDNADVMRESARRALESLGLSPLTGEEWAELRAGFAELPFKRTVHADAVGLLAELRGRGFLVGAISDWAETLPEMLAEMQLRPHLDALAVSAIVGVTKPNPKLFQDALNQVAVTPNEALHIGDYYELDVAGARAAGMNALLFDWKGRMPAADCPRVETFDALTEYLLALPAPA